ncbi:MAG: PSP1 C-terminal domain-containing protein [Eggerthellaceae bacterium]
MVRIAPINLYYNPKTLCRRRGPDVRAGDGVIVSTARGTEPGRAAHDVFSRRGGDQEAESPLKLVKRIVNARTRRAADEAKSREALPVFKEMAAEGNGDMHPVSVEYLFEGDKAIFYFEAEERVDFASQRQLAAHFRAHRHATDRRDEARMVGGLGIGQSCQAPGRRVWPVSIRMASRTSR